MTDVELPQIYLFTDGACSGNPGPGGWAYILRHVKSGKEKEASGAARMTTSNRMELIAVISGLEALREPCAVTVLTDSVYVGKGLSQWLPKWKADGWQRREGLQWKPVKNDELWKRLDELLSVHRVVYQRVAGHSGHPENERCDQLAVKAYKALLKEVAR